MRQGRRCVVQVISNLGYGGAERHVVELANHLDPEKFEVHICTLSTHNPLADGLSDAKRRLHVIRKWGRYDVSVIFRLAMLLHRLGADIVHSYLFDAEIATRIAGRLAATPLVIGSEQNSSNQFRRRHLWTYRLTRGCVDLIVANSESGVRFNSRTLGHPRALYRVVRGGVKTARFRPLSAPQRALVRAELGLAPAAPVVGMFASFKPQKRHPLFIEALARVVQLFPQTRALFVGDVDGDVPRSQSCRREVDRLVGELGLGQHCLFLGNRPDVHKLYGACDVTVLPSEAEGTPNAVLESMACGVPVVVSDVSDNEYLVPQGRAGYVVPFGDVGALSSRLCTLLGDGELRQQMGREARAWVEAELSSAHLASRTAAVYDEALSSHRGDRSG